MMERPKADTLSGSTRVDTEKELVFYGLNPGTWKDAERVIKGVLSPTDWDTFNRLHRNFVGYRSISTSDKFYGFVFSHDLHMEINRHRFRRLSQILQVLSLEVNPAQSILEVGAGAGILADLIKKQNASVTYMVQDQCKEVQGFLERKGLPVLEHPTPARPPVEPFDLILCVDSLGEVNSDEDDLLYENSPVKDADFPLLLEERYGIALKLHSWKPYLAPSGRVLFWEPFKHQRAWNALTKLLQSEGWKVSTGKVLSAPAYLELRLT